MPKREVRHKKMLRKYHCIETPIDYSNDGREEERREAQQVKDYESKRSDGGR